MEAAVIDFAALLSERFPEAAPMDFYRDLFPEGALQRGRDGARGEYPAIAVTVRPEGNVRRTVTDDLSAVRECIEEARPGDLCVMSPVTYAGDSQRKSMAHALHALVFDLDGIKVRDGEPVGFKQLLYQTGDILETAAANFALPVPTYVVASGTGLHLYYLLDEPIVLWPAVLDRVEAYRAALTRKLWNAYITDLYDSVQYEGATQGFRMVGTPVKPSAGAGVARAFLTGARVSTAYMDGFVPEKAAIGPQRAPGGRTPMAVARERWPEWHRRRVVEGVPRGSWRAKRDLYEWWKRRVAAEGEPGHRYNCIVALAAYARKCGVPRDELASDAAELRAVLDRRDPDNPFTEQDVRDALTAYRPGMVRYPIDEIVRRTGISIEKSKRNGRKQSLHLRMARSNLAILSEEAGHALQGRPDKSVVVLGWRRKHPFGNKSQCARDTGLSRVTVTKWWDSKPEGPERDWVPGYEGRVWHEGDHLVADMTVGNRITEMMKAKTPADTAAAVSDACSYRAAGSGGSLSLPQQCGSFARREIGLRDESQGAGRRAPETAERLGYCTNACS